MFLVVSALIFAVLVVVLDRICNDKFDRSIREINEQERDTP